jgi:signal peptidase II
VSTDPGPRHDAAAPGEAGSDRRPRLVHWIAVIAAAVVAADQVTKSLAVASLADRIVHVVWTLQLNLSFNSGLAFSQGRGLTPVITVAGLVLVAGLLWFARHVSDRTLAVALGLVLGGACGNLADRLVRGNGGAVIDFLDLQWWPVFNLADVAISCGAILLVLRSLRDGR